MLKTIGFKLIGATGSTINLNNLHMSVTLVFDE